MARHSIVLVDPKDLIQIETLLRDILRALIQEKMGEDKPPLGPGFLEGVNTQIAFEEEERQTSRRDEKRFRVSVHRNEIAIRLRNEWAQPEGMSFNDFFLLIQMRIEQALIPTGKLSAIHLWGPPYTISIVPKK